MNDQEKAGSIARDILALARNSLVVNFRFLDRAVSRLEFIADEKVSLATDGESIYYSPWYILRIYKNEQTAVTRDLFHSILHCVFRHNFIGRDIDRLRWDLASDIAVENALTEFDSPVLRAARESGQRAMTALLREELGTLTAERIYKWLGDRGLSEEELLSEREKFRGDGHGIWYWEFDPEAKIDRNINLKKVWEDVSKRMQTELETMLRDNDSALVQNLRSLNRAKHSYSEFLRRFMTCGEVMRLSEEEFDNNYYTYGLELLGNIPLIEPLEYSEQRRIRDFVIAIDTSGSCDRETVSTFLKEVYGIFSRKENFFHKMQVVFFQCDCCLQDVTWIHSPEDWMRYTEHVKILGRGGTDYTPVFREIEKLRSEKRLPKPRALLYFTDGDGVYPHRPDYETVFILAGPKKQTKLVPQWACVLELE